MALYNKLDANSVGLRYAIETSFKTLPSAGSRTWTPLDPNSYSDFGGNVSTVARSPIEAGRQQRKGVVVDLDAGGQFNIDLTSTNLEELLEGAMFAARRMKANEETFGALTGAAVTGGASGAFASTAAFTQIDANTPVKSLWFASGFAESANNGVHEVDAACTTSALNVGSTLVAEADAPAAAKLTCVGYSGDTNNTTTAGFAINAVPTWPTLTVLESGDISFLDVDGQGTALLPGEWIYMSGWTDATNNGWKRIRTVSATQLTFDKSEAGTMVTDDGTNADDVDIYWGHVLKNEDGTEASFPITRTTYHLERDLGEPDDGSSNNQYEYLVGAVFNEFTLNLSTADKMTADCNFIAGDAEQYKYNETPTRDGSDSFPDLVESDAFNTTSDVTRFQVQLVDATDEAPTPQFAYLTDGTISINNNASLAKAIGTLGGFDVVVGTFQVSGNITAYFVDIGSVQAVRNNSDVTIDLILVKDNKGIVIDFPLVALGDGRVNAEKDQAIQVPVSFDAAKGSKVLSTYTHTMLWGFFRYVP